LLRIMEPLSSLSPFQQWITFYITQRHLEKGVRFVLGKIASVNLDVTKNIK
jgi:hypothetical protein